MYHQSTKIVYSFQSLLISQDLSKSTNQIFLPHFSVLNIHSLFRINFPSGQLQLAYIATKKIFLEL